MFGIAASMRRGRCCLRRSREIGPPHSGLSSREAETGPNEEDPHNEHVLGSRQETEDTDYEGSDGDGPGSPPSLLLAILTLSVEEVCDKGSDHQANTRQQQLRCPVCLEVRPWTESRINWNMDKKDQDEISGTKEEGE